MAKQKKKRNKSYRGTGAAMSRPQVTRIAAVQRGAFGQWWFDNKSKLRLAGIALLIALAILLVISGIVSLVI